MNNTVPNVPRELLERLAEWDQFPHKVKDALTDLRALLSAPSPAGVDAATITRYNLRWPGHQGCPIDEESSGEYVLYSDHQAIIDGLRGEVERLQQELASIKQQVIDGLRENQADAAMAIGKEKQDEHN